MASINYHNMVVKQHSIIQNLIKEIQLVRVIEEEKNQDYLLQMKQRKATLKKDGLINNNIKSILDY